MADEAVQTPTTEEQEQQFQALQFKLASELAAPVIIDRLVNQYGHVLNSPEEANAAINASFRLLDLYKAGMLELNLEQPEETDIQKSANAVAALFEEVVTSDTRRNNVVMNPEVHQAAAQMASLLCS